MENINDIITENIEDVITAIPEEVVPVNTFGGFKAAGMLGLGAIVGIAVYEGGKRAVSAIKAKKASKDESEDNVVEIEDFVEEDESK